MADWLIPCNVKYYDVEGRLKFSTQLAVSVL